MFKIMYNKKNNEKIRQKHLKSLCEAYSKVLLAPPVKSETDIKKLIEGFIERFNCNMDIIQGLVNDGVIALKGEQ